MTKTEQKFFCADISTTKGIAIRLIIICHIGEIFADIDVTLFYLFTTGQMACQLFFICSSFALCLSYSRSHPSYREFFYKRIKRIAPPYWGAIIISAFLCFLSPFINDGTYSSFFKDPVKIIINALLLNGCTPYGNNDIVYGGWFVGTIVIFYLLYRHFYTNL